MSLLTKVQVANRLGLSPSTVDRLRQDDRTFPPAATISGSLRWRPDDIDAWIDGHFAPPADSPKRGSRKSAAELLS